MLVWSQGGEVQEIERNRPGTADGPLGGRETSRLSEDMSWDPTQKRTDVGLIGDFVGSID